MFGTPGEAVQYVLLEAPGVGIADMIDPTLDARIELSEA